MTLQEAQKKLLENSYQGILYQYTKWDALHKMISLDDSGPRFTLRMCCASQMNDRNECVTGGISYVNALKRPECNNTRNTNLKNNAEQILEDKKRVQENYYLSSFSGAKDSLPMWNMYGGNCGGVSIGIDSLAISQQGFSLLKCIYDDTLIQQISESLSDFYLSTDWYNTPADTIRLFNDTSYKFNALAKNHHFCYEDEFRLFLFFEYFISGNLGRFEGGRFELPVHFEPRKDKIISFVEIEFPIDIVKEIWLGPTNNMDDAYASTYFWLCSMNLQDKISIHKSTAPYR